MNNKVRINSLADAQKRLRQIDKELTACEERVQESFLSVKKVINYANIALSAYRFVRRWR